jgi:hypothetical protein
VVAMLVVFVFAHLTVTCVTAELRKCGSIRFSGYLRNEHKHYFGRCQSLIGFSKIRRRR